MLTLEEKEELLLLDQERQRRRARASLLGFTCYTMPDYEVNWHHELIFETLDRFVAGEIKNLMILAPPRHGKSELASRRLPAYLLGKRPDDSVIAASYSDDLASRMNRDVQRIMDEPRYRDLFPETQIYGKNIRTTAHGSWLRNSEIFEVVGRRGVYRSAGIGSGITGMGARWLIIDDPIKDQKQADSQTIRDGIYDWFWSTAYSRLAKGGQVLIIQTCWHMDDLVGRLLAESRHNPKAPQWKVLRLPAIYEEGPPGEFPSLPGDNRKPGEPLWPASYGLDFLTGVRNGAGPSKWSALYQQRPAVLEGAIIRREWIQFYRKGQLPPKFDCKVTSWDLRFKDADDSGDFVAGQAWGRAGANYYLLGPKEIRDRLSFSGSVAAVRLFAALHHRDASAHLVENKANGPALVDALKKEISRLVLVEPDGGKEERLRATEGLWAAGNVWLPHPDDCPWILEWIEELVGFPKMAHDDRADAASQALRYLEGANLNFLKHLTRL